MQDDKEDRIRRRAHAIWEAEGRPEGRHEAHWEQARAEIEAIEASGGPDGQMRAEEPAAQPAGEDAPADSAPKARRQRTKT